MAVKEPLGTLLLGLAGGWGQQRLGAQDFEDRGTHLGVSAQSLAT